jgi:3-hydroxy-9,10-secoandrosta-1,3,5(10)-triene-9,17-dione monooxygenase
MASHLRDVSGVAFEGAAPRPRGTARSFADVDYEEAMRRARALLPELRRLAPAAEAARRMTPEIENLLHDSGLLRFLQPKRFGGMELPFVAYVDLPEMLGRADCSVGWNFANLAVHHWMLALYDPRAQEEVWGDNPDALIASGIAYPQGKARKVDGGIVLSGHWNFSSSVDPSGWNMLACMVRDGDKVIDHRMCLLPASDYEIVTDWDTMGMRGTGSNSVKVNEVFVPEHRALSMYVARGGPTFPGYKLHTNPLYQVSLGGLGTHCLGGAMVGNAQGALEGTIEMVKERSTNYTAARMRDFQTVQLRVGAAGAKVDLARLSMRSDCLEAEAFAKAGKVPPIEDKLRYRRNVALACKLATEAVDALHEMSGANGLYTKHTLERQFRDAHSGGNHIGFNWDAGMTTWGLVALGGEFNSPTM